MILHKGLEHIQILVFAGVLEQIPVGYQGVTLIAIGLYTKSKIFTVCFFPEKVFQLLV